MKKFEDFPPLVTEFPLHSLGYKFSFCSVISLSHHSQTCLQNRNERYHLKDFYHTFLAIILRRKSRKFADAEFSLTTSHTRTLFCAVNEIGIFMKISFPTLDICVIIFLP